MPEGLAKRYGKATGKLSPIINLGWNTSEIIKITLIIRSTMTLIIKK